jgi:hypothetical protein
LARTLSPPSPVSISTTSTPARLTWLAAPLTSAKVVWPSAVGEPPASNDHVGRRAAAVGEHVATLAAVEVDDHAAAQHRGVERVVSGPGRHREPVDRLAVAHGDAQVRGQAGDPGRTVGHTEDEGVVRRVAGHGDDIDLRVARGAQVDVHLPEVGAPEVADQEAVGALAAGGGEGEAFDVVDVERDAGDVAGDPHVAVLARHADGLGDVGGVEHERVVARAAVDGVAAAAGVPGDDVVAAAAAHAVGIEAAVQAVRAATAVDRVGAGAAEDGVRAVAGRRAAVVRDGGGDEAGSDGLGVDAPVKMPIGQGPCFDFLGARARRGWRFAARRGSKVGAGGRWGTPRPRWAAGQRGSGRGRRPVRCYFAASARPGTPA